MHLTRPAWRRRLSGLHKKAPSAGGYSLSLTAEPGGGARLVLAGRLDLGGLEQIEGDLGGVWEQTSPKRLVVDLSGVTYLDSAGALALGQLEQQAAARGVELAYQGLGPAAQGIKGLLDWQGLARQPLIPAQRYAGLLDQLGETWLAVVRDVYLVIAFLGEFLAACGRAAVNPKLLRVSEVLLYMEQVGVNGLPIVGLISFLLGLIMAFMSSLQLKPFGANIYVANLVALAMVKELGPIMTAVLVAGRSGSAFAAEIGTMKVNEEVDALVVMGYDPLVFLALPKVLAAVLTVPILTLFSDLMAITGGLVVGVAGMGLTAGSYIDQTIKSLNSGDILTGMLKSATFALLIAGIGCQRGFMVRGGAQAVGTATTSAVVSAMFLIIVADSIFAVVLHYAG
ncbi:MAG: MlaE family lipid ABC transporter permease subunit [Desulfarculus sp.]|nr:MlaE family lipid ABC transporter permease subunit [Desulfarculus sp.]